MLEKTTIARPYAQAAFEYARESGEVEKWSAMAALLAMIVSDQQMHDLISNPKVTDEQLLQIVVDIAPDRFTDSFRNFIRTLIQAERLQYAPDISRLFEKMLAEAEGRVDVEVISAYSLESNQEKTISDAMAKRLGKKIGLSSRVDDHLIGGVVIRAGDSVIDASIRGRLNELKNQLT